MFNEILTQKVRLYARVSTDEQARHGLSIRAQKDALQKWAEENRASVLGVYIDDGYSAKNVHGRPALMKLLREYQDGDVLVVTKMDRLSRDVLDANKIIKGELTGGVPVMLIDLSDRYLDLTTASGRANFNMRLTWAQMEREQISERIKTVFDDKRARGEVVTGIMPKGYKVEGKFPVIDEEWEWYPPALFEVCAAESGNLYRTTQIMTERYGLTRDIQTYRRDLANPRYAGADKFPALVDQDLFDKVQIMRAQRRTEPRKKGTGPGYIFTGLVPCPKCGHMLTGQYSIIANGSRKTNLRCSPSMKRGEKMHVCISERKIEKLCLAALQEAAKLEQITIELEGLNNEKDQAEKELKKLESRRTRLIDMYEMGDIDRDRYRTKMELVNAQILDAKAKIKSADAPSLAPYIETSFIDMYNGWNVKQKSAFWHNLVSRIEISEDRKSAKLYFL